MNYLFAIILFFVTISAQSLKDLYKRGYINFENDLTIGDEHKDEIFSFFALLGIDDNENIFVKDNKKICFLKFDKNGKFISKISNKGKGPGEITIYGTIELDNKGNLICYDFGLSRITFFDNSGKYKNSYKAGAGFYAKYKALPNDNIILEKTDYDEDGKLGGEIKNLEVFSPSLKRLFKLTSSPRVNNKQNLNKTQETKISLMSGFEDSFFWDVLPNGNIVTALSGDFTVKIFSPDGKMIKSFIGIGEKRILTEKDKELFFEKLNKANTKRFPELIDVIKKQIIFPSKTPFFNAMQIDNEGNILFSSYEKDEKYTIWVVYSIDGNFISKVKIPSKINGIYKKGKVYQLEETDEGKEIKRYKIK